MKKILSFAVKLVVSGGILLYLFYFSDINIQKVIATLKQTRLPVFFLAFFVYLCTIFISSKRWSLFLPEPMKYSRIVSLYFIGSFFNTFLPGLVGGDAVKAFYLYKDTGKGGASLVSVFMDRYMGLTAMIGLGIIAFIGGYSYIKGTDIVWMVPVLFGGFLLASLILWKLNWGKIKILNMFYEPLMGFKSEAKIITKALLLAFIIQIFGITSAYILSLSIGINIPIIYFFMFVPIISVVAAIPANLAGLGFREAGFVFLFTTAAGLIIKEEAMSLSLLVFTIMCMANLIGGVEYVRIKKLPEKKS